MALDSGEGRDADAVVFLVELHATPGEGSRADGVGGAYVNVWVLARDGDDAGARAAAMVAQAGWTPEAVQGVLRVERAVYLDEPELLSYYDEAIETGGACVFHCYAMDDAP